LKGRGCAQTEGEGQWKITEEGRELLETGGGKEKGKKGERKESSDIFVPSQADLFRSIGEKLSMALSR
jgi:hypothetical protein